MSGKLNVRINTVQLRLRHVRIFKCFYIKTPVNVQLLGTVRYGEFPTHFTYLKDRTAKCYVPDAREEKK